MLSSIVKALDNKGRTSPKISNTFYAERSLNIDVLDLNISGIGKITLPLDPTTIQKLLSVSTPAKFGLRDKTLLDKNVRNTHEIPAERLTIAYGNKQFSDMMISIRDTLGLSSEARLVPHLHNMLIYEAGQFFKAHQDSEKLKNMVASLVLALPSPHIGGDLLIRHHDKQHRFVSENLDSRSIECVAFYADCQHEIEKIKKGNRVVLTYNLVLEGAKSVVPTASNLALEKALSDYFDLTHLGDHKNPMKLAYFLEHSYTEHSLNWHMLKGSDSQKAQAFCAAAEKLGLVPHLALVEIHECWSTDGDEYGNDPEPTELIDSGIELSFWMDKDNHRLPYAACSLSEDETCSSIKIADLEPDETEHEGYMGNYGNTLDYWYRRAAVVLWPLSNQTAMEFKLNYTNALQSLLKLTQKPNNQKTALDIIHKAGGFLDQYKHINRMGDKDKEYADYLTCLAKIAAYIQDAEVAKNLLVSFSISVLAKNTIDPLIALQKQYGVAWCLDVLECWKANAEGNYPRKRLVEEIESLMKHALDSGVDMHLVESTIAYYVDRHIKHDTQNAYAKPSDLKKTLPERISTVGALLRASFSLSRINISQKIIQHIITAHGFYPLFALAELMSSLQEYGIPKSHHATTNILRDYAVSVLDQELKKGEKAADDWSIEPKLPCKCEQCRNVNVFLDSPSEYSKTMAIVAQHRDHIMNTFHGQELPVRISVIKKGSPYKLVLDKQATLHKEANDHFKSLKILRTKLQ